MTTMPFQSVNFGSAPELVALLEQVFEADQRRLKHVLEVARRVKETATTLSEAGKAEIDVDLAYRSALLHDIGYAEGLIDTGFHPIDGARYLEKAGFPDIASFIVCHSNSPEQAVIKGLPEIDISENLIADLITYWDVQVMQGGECVPYAERLADIKERHGVDSAVWKAHQLASARIEAVMAKINSLLGS